ncbi:MAG: hypothetical protein WC532_08835 [Candidatus Omnitrophota bacterium]
MTKAGFFTFGFLRKQKWLSVILALAFLLNTISPAFAREGNSGRRTSLEMYGLGALAGSALGASILIGYETGQWWGVAAAAAANMASDLTGLVMYYYFYESYGETATVFGKELKFGNVEISKGMLYSMYAGTITGALVGIVGGLASGASSGASSSLESGASSGIESAAASAGEGAVSGAATGAASGATSGAVAGAANSVITAIVNAAKALWQAIVNAAKAIWTALKNAWQAIVKFFDRPLKEILKSVGKALWENVLKPILEPIWKNLIKPIWNFITHPIRTIKDFFARIAKTAADNNINWLRAAIRVVYKLDKLKPGSVANPYIRYGAERSFGAAFAHLVGDLVINTAKLFFRETIKQNLEKGFEITIGKGKNKKTLIAIDEQDETIAEIAADIATIYFSACITPTVRILLGNLMHVYGGKGKFVLDNQGGYLSKEGEGFIDEGVTYEIDAVEMNSQEINRRLEAKQIKGDAMVKVTRDGKTEEIKAEAVANMLNGKNYTVTLQADVTLNGETVKAGTKIAVNATEFTNLWQQEGVINKSGSVDVTNTDGVTQQISAEAAYAGAVNILSASYTAGITIAAHDYFQMRESETIKEGSTPVRVTSADKKNQVDTTAKELDGVFNDTYVQLEMARRLENKIITFQDAATGELHEMKMSEVAREIAPNKDGTVGVQNDNGTYSVVINGKEVIVDAATSAQLHSNLVAYATIMASSAHQTALALTGGLLNDIHGNPVSSKPLKAGLQTMRSIGLHPLVGAGVKILALKLMKYRTHYGDESGRVAENAKKMAIADFFGNLASSAVANSSRFNTWYAGTDENPYVQRGDSGEYLGREYAQRMGKEFVTQTALLANELAWANYCKKKDITPDALDEVRHLAAGSLVSGLVDAIYRRDPGTVEKKDQVLVETSGMASGNGELMFVDRDSLTESTYDKDTFLFKVNGEDLRGKIRTLDNKEKVFLNEDDVLFVGAKAPDDNKKWSAVTWQTNNASVKTGGQVSYNVTYDVSSRLNDPQFQSRQNLTAGKFVKSVAQDFNNHFIQAAARSSLYLSPMFTPGTGPAGFLAQQQMQDQWIQHIQGMAQGTGPGMLMANRLGGNMRYYANMNVADSLGAAITNRFMRQELRSYATFMTTQEKLQYLQVTEEKNLKRKVELLGSLRAFNKEYGGDINKLNADIEQANIDLATAEQAGRVDEVNTMRKALETMYGMVIAADEVLKKAYSLQIVRANEVYSLPAEAQSRIFNDLMPEVIDGLQADVDASAYKIGAMERAKGSLGILSSVPILGAMIQSAVLSNLATSTGQAQGINDFIIGGIVDYNVDRTFDIYAPMSGYTAGALESTVDNSAKTTQMSEKDKQAFRSLLKDPELRKRSELRSNYSMSVAGVYQGSESYANTPLLNASGISQEVRSTRMELREAETGGKALVVTDSTKIDAINVIKEMRKNNPNVEAFTYIPEDKDKTPEQVETALYELKTGRVLFSDYGLTSRTTVDQFGRAVETRHYAPDFVFSDIGSEWQTGIEQDVITRHYYGPFGHAVSITTDYTQIGVPDADNWPGAKDWTIGMGKVWNDLAAEFKVVGVTPEQLAGKLGIELTGQESAEELQVKFTSFLQEKLKEGPDAIEKIDADIKTFAGSLNVEPKNIGGDFSNYIPKIKKYVYATDPKTGEYRTDKSGRLIPIGSVLNAKAAQTQRFLAAAQNLREGKPIEYSYAGKEDYQVTALKVPQEEIDKSRALVTQDMLEEFAGFATDVYGKKVRAKDINMNTPWGGILAYMAVNPQPDGRKWSELTTDEKQDIFAGVTAWRLLTYGLYAEDPNVKQTIPNNQSTLTLFLGSGADQIRGANYLYVPAIAGQKMEPLKTTLTGPEGYYQPVSVGPNYSYDISIYSTGEGKTPYSGPSHRASVSDINSGPALNAAAQYTLPTDAVERQLQQLVYNFAATDFKGADQRAELIGFMKNELGIDEEDAIAKVDRLNSREYGREFLEGIQEKVDESRINLDKITQAPLTLTATTAQTETPKLKTQALPNMSFPDLDRTKWAMQRLEGQDLEVYTAVQNKQQELNSNLNRDLSNVKQMQFFEYKDIGGRTLMLPTWGMSMGSVLQTRDDAMAAAINQEELRFSKLMAYNYDRQGIETSIDKGYKEALVSGNDFLTNMFKETKTLPINGHSLVMEPNNNGMLGAFYDRSTTVYVPGEYGSYDAALPEGTYKYDGRGSADVIQRSQLRLKNSEEAKLVPLDGRSTSTNTAAAPVINNPPVQTAPAPVTGPDLQSQEAELKPLKPIVKPIPNNIDQSIPLSRAYPQQQPVSVNTTVPELTDEPAVETIKQETVTVPQYDLKDYIQLETAVLNMAPTLGVGDIGFLSQCAQYGTIDSDNINKIVPLFAEARKNGAIDDMGLVYLEQFMSIKKIPIVPEGSVREGDVTALALAEEEALKQGNVVEIPPIITSENSEAFFTTIGNQDFVNRLGRNNEAIYGFYSALNKLSDSGKVSPDNLLKVTDYLRDHPDEIEYSRRTGELRGFEK